MLVQELKVQRPLNENDKRKLNYFAARNEGIYHLIVSPAKLRRGAWSKALAMAQETGGPDTVFRILQALGTSVGPVEGRRYCNNGGLYLPL